LVPCAANVVYVSNVEVLRGVDPTPFAFTLTGGVLLWGCLRSRLLDLVPVAREAIVEEMADGLIVTDRYGRVLDTNRAAQSLPGLSGPAAPGRKLADLLPSLPISSLLAALHETLHQGDQEHPPHRRPSREHPQREPPHREYSPIVREMTLVAGQDHLHYELEMSPLRSGGGVPVERVVVVVRDITERKWAEAALAESRQRLSHQALHDPLTGLPNRYLFESRLEEVPRHSRTAPTGDYRNKASLDEPYVEHVAILFIDLDGFKEVNDSLGHPAGDDLLRTVAERLEAGVRTQDTAARFGGDEFCVLLAGVSDTAEAVRIAQRLGEALQEPFAIGTSREHMERISASIGVAVGRADNETPLDELVREADAAMYRAKKKGKGLYEVVDLDEDAGR
ncbi:MAG: diguanylate cyclase, partial [Rubrobacteraceae bacterium]